MRTETRRRSRCGTIGGRDETWGIEDDVARQPKTAEGRRRPAVEDSVEASTRATPKARKPTKRTAAQGNVLTTLPAAMTGRASPAKAAVGDKPVFAYISSLPQPQRSIAERVDALAAKTLPGLQRSVKWGMAWYGVGDGWCFSCGGFDGHVKLTFGRGTSLTPVPPVDADRDGQGLARRRPRIRGRHRRTPSSRRGCSRPRPSPVSGNAEPSLDPIPRPPARDQRRRPEQGADGGPARPPRVARPHEGLHLHRQRQRDPELRPQPRPRSSESSRKRCPRPSSSTAS